jgi:uncharacterized YigZ family protein
MSSGSYKTIDKTGKAEFSDRGSKFLGFAFSVKDIAQFKERLQAIKDLHPKASHHCYAYRIGYQGEQWRASDNGEPSGTAGRPMLGQLESHQLLFAAVVVVRYFGGTLLGVPGLINAYRSAAQLAIEKCTLLEKPILRQYQLQFDYTLLNEVMRLVKKRQLHAITNTQALFCELTLGIPIDIEAAALEELMQLQGLEIKALETT